MRKISNVSRIILIVCAVALLGMLKLPIWKILLSAPQYPEGLEMKIWKDTLTGDVGVISALNHYIGMRKISVEMFPEFQYLTTVIWVVVAICLALALIGRMWSAITYYLVLALADSAALYDFYRWGYDYGHNLDPTAPIVIPGMAYQPPVIGYKKLLNFEAWSLPDLGGWILMIVTAVSFFVVVFEWWKNRKKTVAPAVLALVLAAMPALQSCSGGPQPIQFGTDNCDNCKMTLVDRHYGGEIVTQKGKAYKFDDLNCMMSFLKKKTVPADQVAQKLVVDYNANGQLIDATTAFYLYSEQINTPMGSGFIAFSTEADRQKVAPSFSGTAKSWSDVEKAF